MEALPVQDAQYHELLFLDELTGIYNRRFYSSRIKTETAQAQQNNLPLAVAVVDVDYFKTINDTYGHHEGDRILATIGALMKEACQEPAIPIRYGGDEFVVLMAGMNRAEGKALLEHLSETVRNHPFELEDGRVLQLTLSVGVAAFPEDVKEAEKTFDAADAAVYVSKKGGRNQVSTPALGKKAILFDSKNFHRLFPCPRLIGRNDLMLEIRPHLAPRAGVVRPLIVLEGVSGAGKSRLLDECRATIDTQRSAVLLARGQPYLLNQPFGVIVEALRYLTRADRRMAQVLVANLSPQEIRAVAPLVPDVARSSLVSAEEALETAQHSSEGSRKVIVGALVRMLLDCGEGKLLTLIVDDLHWCDTGTLEVLQSLKGSIEGESVLILAALRRRSESGGEDDRAVEEFVVSTFKKKLGTALEVEPLTYHHVKEMVGAIVPGLEQKSRLVDIVTRLSRALPLLVEEILKFLIQREYIVMEDDQLKVSEFSEDDIPANIDELLLLRAQSLDQQVRDFMSKASVIGTSFDINTLRALEATNEGELMGVLDQGRDMSLIVPDQDRPESYRFMSQTAQQALYRQLEDSLREALHAQVANVEESRSADTTPNMGRLAYHHQHAGNIDRASEVLSRLDEYEQAPVAFPGQQVIRTAPADAKTAPKDWGKEDRLSSEGMQDAIRLARELRVSIQNYRLFPASNEIVVGIRQSVLSQIEHLLEETETLSFGAADGTLLINGEVPVLKSKSKAARIDFITFLEDSGLRGISFKRGITIEEVQLFLQTMCLKPEAINQRGGWTSILTEHSIEHILVNEKVYVAVGERDILYKKEGNSQNYLVRDVTGMDADLSGMNFVPGGGGGGSLDLEQLLRQLQDNPGLQDALRMLQQGEGKGQTQPSDLRSVRDKLDRMAQMLNQPPEDSITATQPSEAASAGMQEFLNLQREISETFRRLPRHVVPAFIGEISEQVDVLAKDLESGNNLKIAIATEALMSRGMFAVEPLINLILSTDDLRARRVALHCLHRVGVNVLDRLLEELHRTQHHDEKRRLVATLGEYQDPRVVRLLEPFVRFPEPIVRREAMRVLEGAKGLEPVQILRSAMFDENESVQQDAIASLGRIGHAAPVQDLIKLIGKRSILFFEDQIGLQREACIALGQIRDYGAVPYLVAALRRAPWWTAMHTKDPLIRAAAALALSNFQGPEIEAELRMAARDRNPVVRSGAKVALNKLLRPNDVEEVLLGTTELNYGSSTEKLRRSRSGPNLPGAPSHRI